MLKHVITLSMYVHRTKNLCVQVYSSCRNVSKWIDLNSFNCFWYNCGMIFNFAFFLFSFIPTSAYIFNKTQRLLRSPIKHSSKYINTTVNKSPKEIGALAMNHGLWLKNCYTISLELAWFKMSEQFLCITLSAVSVTIIKIGADFVSTTSSHHTFNYSIPLALWLSLSNRSWARKINRFPTSWFLFFSNHWKPFRSPFTCIYFFFKA